MNYTRYKELRATWLSARNAFYYLRGKRRRLNIEWSKRDDWRGTINVGDLHVVIDVNYAQYDYEVALFGEWRHQWCNGCIPVYHRRDIERDWFQATDDYIQLHEYRYDWSNWYLPPYTIEEGRRFYRRTHSKHEAWVRARADFRRAIEHDLRDDLRPVDIKFVVYFGNTEIDTHYLLADLTDTDVHDFIETEGEEPLGEALYEAQKVLQEMKTMLQERGEFDIDKEIEKCLQTTT